MANPARRNEILLALAIAIASVALGYAAPRHLGALGVAENWTRDLRFAAWAPPRPQSPNVVVVAITEDTLAKLPYRSPVDRGFLANLVQALDAKEPAAIGIDILFDQPTEKDKDIALRQTLLSAKAPVALAFAGNDQGLTAAQRKYLDAFTNGIGVGLANLAADSLDGTVRWIFPGMEDRGRWRDGLVPALARAIGKTPPSEQVALAYRPGPDDGKTAFRRYPAHAAAFLPKAWFRDKVVLIGADLPMSDRHRTPFAVTRGSGAGRIPGVVIHAHALDQIIEGGRLPTPGPPLEFLVLFVMAGLGMALAVLDRSLVAKSLAGLAASGLFVLAVIAFYAGEGVLLPLLGPLIAFVVSGGVGTAWMGRRDRKQKKFIREAFRHYLDPQVVDRLADDPSSLKVGGERREVTYMFSDLAGFTTLTEQTDPDVMSAILNPYLDNMFEILTSHGGTIDKVVGDAVVGIFGAPLDQPDHRARAVSCMLDMDAFCQAYSAEWNAKGIPLKHTRIGAHSGMAVIGNFGGNKFFDYTGHGDTVNTAARLESVNKHLGTRLCVSRATADGCPGHAFRPVGSLVLKGKTEGLAVVEPLLPGASTAERLAAYVAAYDMMSAEDPAALEAFRRLAEDDPDDGLAAFHLDRLESGGTGVFIVMKEK